MHSRSKTLGTQTPTNTCTYLSKPITTLKNTEIMDAEQKEAFQNMFTEMYKLLREDIAKESLTQQTKLDMIGKRLENQRSTVSIQPEVFDGNPTLDALNWLDSFSRIANINNSVVCRKSDKCFSSILIRSGPCLVSLFKRGCSNRFRKT